MWLKNIPIPPSLNNAYPTGRGGGRYKSKELVCWEREFSGWACQNANAIGLVRQELATAQRFLSIDCVYYFRKERILTKDGRAKRLDVDNRLKILIDAVTNLTAVDDSLVWQGSFKKVISQTGVDFCDVRVSWVY